MPRRARSSLVVLGIALTLFLLLRSRGGGGGERGRAPEPPRSEPPPASTRRPVTVGTGATAGARPRVERGGVPSAPGVEDNNRAVGLLGEGRTAEAIVLFESARAADPDSLLYRRNLAEARVRLALQDHDEGRVRAALEGLDAALALAPDREDLEALAALRERWRAELDAEADFVSEGSDLFTLLFDAERSDLLHDSQTVLDHLETAYERLRGWFGRDPVREGLRGPIRVVLQEADDFHRVTGLGDWAGGAFDGTVRVAVGDLGREGARWRRTASHELVHAFLDALAGPSVPGWLAEGLAQLLADPDPSPALERADHVLGEAFFPLDRLGASFAGWSDPKEVRRAYAESLLLTAALRREYGDDVLRRMAVGCADGRSPSETFEELTSVPLELVVDGVRTR
ncbi:MAG TPA: tetratricopeptide repeat protein [Planctomycetes bacterium]|nr:tetratricopeptide repeat protein [Planctomycetota bacterium]